MHRAIFEKASAAHEKRIQSHNNRTHIRPCNFDVGGFLLHCRLNRSRVSKLEMKWFGPQRVVRALSEFICEVEDLRSGERTTVDGTRLKVFRNNSFEVTEDCLEQLAYQDGNSVTLIESWISVSKMESCNC